MKLPKISKALTGKARIMEGKVHSNWSPEMDNFLKENCQKMSLKQLAHHLGKGSDCTRLRLYLLGLKKFNIIYWSSFEIKYLKENFKTKGDTEIANDLSKISLSGRRWTAGIIEKKRSYLKLIRTEEEIREIQRKNSLSIIKNKNYIRAKVNARRTLAKRRKENVSAVVKLDQEILCCKNRLLEIIIYMIEYHRSGYPGRAKTVEIIRLEKQAELLQKQLEELTVARFKLPGSIRKGYPVNQLDKISQIIYLIILKVAFTPISLIEREPKPKNTQENSLIKINKI